MYARVGSSNFGELVLSYYKFLVDEYGFLVTRVNDGEYKFENSTTRVIVLLERSINLVVEIEPIGEGAKKMLRQNILPSKLGVVAISMCLDSDLKYKIERLSPTSVITNTPVELEKRAYLLRKHCSNILLGNYDDWLQIKECISMRAREFLDIL